MRTKTKSLSELIASKKFDWVNPDIEKHFTLEDVQGTEYKLYHFDRTIFSEDAMKEMEKEGYSAANFHELLLWDKWNDKDWVVALGSARKVDGDRRVPYLGEGGSGRKLGLGWWDGGWGSGYRFLAVRNLSLDTSETRNEPLEI